MRRGARAATGGHVLERILVLRLSSLGDVVLASSFLRSLHEHFPRARVTFVVRDDLAELAAALPHVDEVVPVRRDGGASELLQSAGALARTPWTHVFDLHQSLRSRILTARLGGRLRRGFHKQELARWMLLRWKRDVYPRLGGAVPLRERMLGPLRRMGLEPRLHDTRLEVPGPARARAVSMLRAAGIEAGAPLVGVAPGARWPSKRWPAERYAGLVARLSGAADRRIVLVGTVAEHGTCAQVAVAAPERCVDLCGRLALLETAAVLERCSIVIANDSGLLHVAEAMGRPVLGIFGPTAPEFGYTPYRATSRLLRRPPPCSPCSKNGSRPCFRPTHECMDNIPVDEALGAAEAMLVQVMQRA